MRRCLTKLSLTTASAFLYLLLIPHVRADFHYVQDIQSDHLIIFVHGLWGGPDTSFTNGKTSWPDLMKSDVESIRRQPPLSTYATAYLGFPAGRSDNLSIPQIATSLLNQLSEKGVFDTKRRLYFIAHSLGGLVVKEMLIDAAISKRHPINKLTTAVFLISSPSSGAEAANFVSKLPTFVPGRLIADVKTITENSYLQTLQKNWHNHLRARTGEFRLSIYCAYETKSIGGLIVVPQQYADAVCDDTPEPLNEDHITIVKPAGRDARIYEWVRGQLAELSMRSRASQHQGAAPADPRQNMPMPPVDLPRQHESLESGATGPTVAPSDPRQNKPDPPVQLRPQL